MIVTHLTYRCQFSCALLFILNDIKTHTLYEKASEYLTGKG